MIFDHNSKAFRERWERCGVNRWNGAFYYSKEIVKNIIPNVKTDRNWVTVNERGECYDHSIVFIHNNKHPDHYDWLKDYKDLVLVCGVPETVPKVSHLGHHAIYLPLSIDVEYVMQYQRPKTKSRAFVGRVAKLTDGKGYPLAMDVLTNMPRSKLLPALAEYREVLAVGRCAIEARALGCEILPYDPRFPDPSVWEVLDNKDAAKILQERLDELDC